MAKIDSSDWHPEGREEIISDSSKIRACLICDSADLHELPDFGSLSRITSDCRPFRPGGRIATCNACGGIQKFCDPKWLAEVKEIYSTYSTYNVVGPLDQMVLDLNRQQELLEQMHFNQNTQPTSEFQIVTDKVKRCFRRISNKISVQ